MPLVLAFAPNRKTPYLPRRRAPPARFGTMLNDPVIGTREFDTTPSVLIALG